MTDDTEQYHMRFGGISRLLGDKVYRRIQHSHICVVGLGGVGSWAAEGLVRTGISTLTMIDLDDICQTNTNRQLHAMVDTVGKSKIKTLKDRFLKINPDIQINIIEDFYHSKNKNGFITKGMDGVIDAFDNINEKCHLAVECIEKNIPIITCGGAAGKDDPCSLKSEDLGYATNDMLLKLMRKQLRRDFNFPKEFGELGIRCVFSSQKAVYPDGKGSLCSKEQLIGQKHKNLDCSTGMGTASFMTGPMGMIAAREILNLLPY